MNPTQLVSLLIFILVFLFIAVEFIPRVYAALLGTFGMVLIGAVRPGEVLALVDLEILGVVLGLYMLVESAEKLGLFNNIALNLIKFSKSPMAFMLILLSFSAIFAMFVSNIGAMLVAASITVSVAKPLKIKSQTVMIFQAIIVNIGGMMLWMSSIPNIIIAMEGELRFNQFIRYVLPLGVVLFIVTLLVFTRMYRSELRNSATEELRELEFDQWLEQAKEAGGMKSRKMGVRHYMATAILIGTIVGFITCDITGWTPASVSLLGGTLMLIIQGQEPNEVLAEIDWGTIIFLAGLFIMINGLDKIGVIELISIGLSKVLGGDPFNASIRLMLLSGLVSSVIDNIPLSSSLAPMVKDLVVGEGWSILWWALIIGANLGGNLTPLGSPSNIIALGVSEQEGRPIPFKRFLSIGLCMSVIYFIISIIYLFLIHTLV